jgi:hypothetical protein
MIILDAKGNPPRYISKRFRSEGNTIEPYAPPTVVGYKPNGEPIKKRVIQFPRPDVVTIVHVEVPRKVRKFKHTDGKTYPIDNHQVGSLEDIPLAELSDKKLFERVDD